MRLEEVFEVASPLINRQIQFAYAELQVYYDRNRHDIDRQITDLFKRLFCMGISAQQEGKDCISCLSISYLYSSLITGTGEIHLALYDDRLYFDENPVFLYWYPEFLWRQFHQDMEKIIRAMKNRLLRLKKYELDAVKTEYAERFFEIGHKMFADYIILIRSEMEKSQLKTTPDFTVIYGGFLDTATVLWRREEI